MRAQPGPFTKPTDISEESSDDEETTDVEDGSGSFLSAVQRSFDYSNNASISSSPPIVNVGGTNALGAGASANRKRRGRSCTPAPESTPHRYVVVLKLTRLYYSTYTWNT